MLWEAPSHRSTKSKRGRASMPNVSRKTGCNSPVEPLTQFLLGLLINAVISVVLGFVSGCGGRNTIRVLRGGDDLDKCIGQLLRDDLER
jgi:hypothetical protein